MASLVDGYEVLSTIGSGSYGKCQKVRRKSDGKVLVWKELDYGSMTEAEKRMLVSEVNLLRELKHPNIVRYYDRIVHRPTTTLYIVMEYCEGGDLASLIAKCVRERRYLEEDFILRVMAQLVLALKDCHRSDGGRTVLHRDLKPANIFLDAKQNVKLGDFGLARILNHDTSFAKTFVGTPYYMSPEQMNGMSYNEKSDIWSLGCVLYELCALTPPFTACNRKELAAKIRDGKFRRIPFRYSEELNSFLARMLDLKDYMRPSVESILQSRLIVGVVEEEQRKAQTRERPGPPSPRHSAPAAELQLREQQLRDRELSLRQREERLEQREQELCVREKLSNEKLARAENILKNWSLMKQQRALSPIYSNDLEPVAESTSLGPKRVHFAGERKENRELGRKPQHHALGDVEKNFQLGSRQILGIR
ncbi:serine/threonine-protein kinase Nek2 [Denticeps clupeoides]|uniref:serine/threonine-protein kinase Nek2 n=1 Tax=Denticeps clupeoides TaxID=299321 RepID=UPI0010A3E919|nr:serine/threonine-protein kinase Nek2 [Denticeps clupeoides]